MYGSGTFQNNSREWKIDLNRKIPNFIQEDKEKLYE